MERRLTAILAADVVGFSRLMGADEAGTLAALKKIRAKFVDPKIDEHHGRIFKLTGDGILAEFPSVVAAVACAAEIQSAMRKQNANAPRDGRIEFRVGINLGDVIIDDEDIYGDGVNIAARLEGLADPGGITVSHSVRDQIGNRLELAFEDRGEQMLKNIEKPIRVYNVLLDDAPSGAAVSAKKQDRPSIAVLPFNNMSGDPEQEYFSDGITEDIITDLSKISNLFVVARHTAFTYKNKPVKVQQIGEELGVGFILEGSVRKAGTRVRVTGQLINAKDGGHIWVERFDRNLTDIFAIQDEITEAIVAQLKVKLLAQEKQSIQRAPTDNVEAYTYYLRGRDFMRRGTSQRYLELARRMFEKAMQLDPNFARACAGIASCDAFLYTLYQVDISLEGIIDTSAKALALDSHLAEARAARGAALSAVRRFDEADIEFEEAMTLDPNSFEAHYWGARHSVAQGKFARAAELAERAATIDPVDYKGPGLLIMIYRSLGQEADSNAAARKGIELAERALALHPEDSRPAVLGALALLQLGEKERAKEWAARAQAIENEDPVSQYNLACVYSHLGDTQTAFELLERAVSNKRQFWKDWIENDSDLDGIRNDPRYAQFITRLHDLYPEK
jgi:adenylate cyclase